MASHERQALLSDDGGGRRGHDDAGKGGGTGVVVAPATDERSATATAGPGMSPLPPFRTTPWRWWWLFVFSLVACFQCLVWFTFSSVPTATKRYYGACAPMRVCARSCTVPAAVARHAPLRCQARRHLARLTCDSRMADCPCRRLRAPPQARTMPSLMYAPSPRAMRACVAR